MTQRRRTQLEQQVLRAAQSVVLRYLTTDKGVFLTPDEAELVRTVEELNAHLDEVVDSPGRWVEGSPETSAAAALSLPNSGSVRKAIIMELAMCHMASFLDTQGLTDEEIERRLRRSHQTCSSARNWLLNAGWIIDSGYRRRTSNRRDAVVWQLSPAGVRHVLPLKGEQTSNQGEEQ